MAVSGYVQSFTHRGVQFTRRTEADHDQSPPWDRSDGHGVVTDEITSEGAAGYEDRSRFKVLSHDGRRTRFYDLQASRALAARDQWGLADQDLKRARVKYGRDLTPEEVTTEAVDADYQFLRGWCRGHWAYVGVIVEVDGTGLQSSVWGIESTSEGYIEDTARELADQILDADLPALYQQLETIAAAAGVTLEGIK